MNPRERVLAAIEHKEPDRVPIDLGSSTTSIHRKAYDELKEFLGIRAETRVSDMAQQIVAPDEPLLKKLKIDTRWIWPGWRTGLGEKLPESYTDIFGVKRVYAGYYYDMPSDGHPLKNANIEDLEEYNWPDPNNVLSPKILSNIEKKAKWLHEKANYAIGLVASASFFELSWYLRSFNRFFVDLKENKNFACKLMDKIVEFMQGYVGKLLEATADYIDIVYATDDLAMQDGPMLSMGMYRNLIKPRQKKIFSLIRQKSDAKIFYHTCGSASFYYNELAEIGVDIVSPVQVNAANMETEMLKREYGDKLCFWGAIDTQKVLPYGSTTEVENEVKKRIHDLAPSGGYVLCAVHNIQPGVSPQNVCAMYKAAREYGEYPIKL